MRILLFITQFFSFIDFFFTITFVSYLRRSSNFSLSLLLNSEFDSKSVYL
ncbi:hypothetical protein HAN_2g364 (nucleomorph) [Hemiselmis andersenii]|uniref:Uncharacterized protein n=1 Tax=Hemiselmis andersenii TaxID=464988 RepID=A9BKK9_HEMAN|nr:hypothetical protein HAN_2g185 [Hemiselmis andersenii]XP_001712505.1 hypothetical protein HAN_2g364 [Hemiselmis andersenii]ABW98015.1 hypothetical protein HAN_2g185 [Hemiselmis andersenii]ABW98180.1 hypothetical protein HAN_2g364 [Hemiselmis andersenii]